MPKETSAVVIEYSRQELDVIIQALTIKKYPKAKSIKVEFLVDHDTSEEYGALPPITFNGVKVTVEL